MNLDVKVIAGARKRAIALEGTLLKVKLLSKPLKGKANEELVEYVAESLGLKRRDVMIVAGERDTRKVVSVPMDIEEVRKTLTGVSV